MGPEPFIHKTAYRIQGDDGPERIRREVRRLHRFHLPRVFTIFCDGTGGHRDGKMSRTEDRPKLPPRWGRTQTTIEAANLLLKVRRYRS